MFLKCEIQHIVVNEQNKYDAFIAYKKNHAEYSGKIVLDEFINPGEFIDVSVYDIIAMNIAEQSKSVTLFGSGPIHLTPTKLFWMIYQVRESNGEHSIVPRGVYTADIVDNEIKVNLINYDVVHLDTAFTPKELSFEYLNRLKNQKKILSCQNNLHLISQYEQTPVVAVLKNVAKHIGEIEKLLTMNNCPNCGNRLSYIMPSDTKRHCRECNLYFKISGGELIEISPPNYDDNKLY